MRHLLFATLCVCCLGAQAAQSYYVAPESRGTGSGLSWDDASDRLYTILEDAEPGDVIYVAQGRYYGGFSIKNGVTMLGGYNIGDDADAERVMPSAHSNAGSILDGCNKYRVLTQSEALDTPATIDGFVIENGSAGTGGGALIMDGATLQNCVVRNCAVGYPSVGDYIDKAKGVVIGVDKESNKINVLSTSFVSNHTQYERAMQFASNTGSLGAANWRIPTADDIKPILPYPSYDIISKTATAHGCKDFGNAKLWTATETESAGLEGRYVANMPTRELLPMNRWQYCRVLPVGSYTETPSSRTTGGGIKATGKATIRNCVVTGNKGGLGSGVHARNGVRIYDTTVSGNDSETNQLNTDDSVIVDTETGVADLTVTGTGNPVVRNVVEASTQIELTSADFTAYSIYSISGQVIDAGKLDGDTTIGAPAISGMYMLSIIDSQNRTTTVKIIVK